MLIHTDSGGGTHEFLSWLTRPGRRLSYSIGFILTEEVQAASWPCPPTRTCPPIDSGGQVRPGAWVAELTGMVKLEGWPKGMRLIHAHNTPSNDLEAQAGGFYGSGSNPQRIHELSLGRSRSASYSSPCSSSPALWPS